MKSNVRIGLITIHHTTNFGSALQTYALYTALKEIASGVEIIDYRCRAVEDRELLRWTVKDPRSIYRFLRYGGSFREKSRVFSEFLNSYAAVSRVYGRGSIGQANRDYDIFLAGSDIIWGLNVTGNDLTYFLDFVEPGKKKIAFASSAGIRWPQSWDCHIGALLGSFQHIGVRETALVQWVREASGREADVVCDPTMLWDPLHWSRMAGDGRVISERYAVIYYCDPQEKILSDAARYARERGISVYYINYGRPIPGIHSIKPLHIREFLNLIMNADCVFSASFHGVLFALYFHRPFFYYNRANFSRMESLALWLGLEDRNGEREGAGVGPELDYGRIDGLIGSRRADSWEKLKAYIDR